jgi:hypothetical protein
MSTAKIYQEFLNNPVQSRLPDFSYAGYKYGQENIPSLPTTIKASEAGVIPNTGNDVTESIQNLIDKTGKNGGGVIEFEAGEYLLNATLGRKNFLRIEYDNIVIRGAGSGTDGTVFRQCLPLTQTDSHPWLSPGIIQTATNIQGSKKFWGVPGFKKDKNAAGMCGALGKPIRGDVYEAPEITLVTASAKRGENLLEVADSTAIKAGGVILLIMRNMDDSGSLLKELLAPIKEFPEVLQTARAAGPDRAPSYQWLVEIAEVLDEKHVKLAQPLRRNVSMDYRPAIHSAPMVHGIGIENIRFASDWQGPYGHHGLPDSTREEAMEMDAGWNAVRFIRVAHGWIRNLVLEGFTIPFDLVDSRNVTVDNIEITDPKKIGGHYATKCYCHACDNLFQNIRVKAYRTHGAGAEGNSYGNVFRNMTFDAVDGQVPDFDFHGFADMPFSPPGCNLFENIKGIGCFTGGGAKFNLPHATHHNVLWNIESADLKENGELIYSWVAEDCKMESYMLFPKSIIAGVRSQEVPVKISGSSQDRDDEWIFVENLNSGNVEPVSLYKAQLEHRLKNKN